MEIQDGRLVAEDVDHVESPNRGGRFAEGALDTIVIHYTAGRSRQTAVDTLTDPERRVSSHLVVGRNGGISQLLPFHIIGWHAGQSAWEGRTAFNNYSIGVEIDNAGQLEERDGGLFSWFGQEYPEEEMVRGVHRNQTEATCWCRYPDVQLQVVDELCGLLVAEYGITHILGHEEIAPDRKVDPGPAFPLDDLRRRLLSPPLAVFQGVRPSAGGGGPGVGSPAAASAAPGGSSGSKARVKARRLNIREAPDAAAERVAGYLPDGTAVSVLETRAGWCRVAVELEGWVAKRYIETG